MSVTVVVFEVSAAPKNGDFKTWLRSRLEAESKSDWHDPKASSHSLNSWFREMRESFPVIVEADPDDPRGTEYSFYKHFVRIDLAGSVAEEGVVTAWKIASKLGLRVLAGGDLLPTVAPKGKRKSHIAALDGVKAVNRPVTEARVGIAIVDPESAPMFNTKDWIYDQLYAERETSDPSILTSDRLRQWNGEFGELGLARPRLFKNFILLYVDPSDLDRVAPTVIKLAKRLRLGVSILSADRSSAGHESRRRK